MNRKLLGPMLLAFFLVLTTNSWSQYFINEQGLKMNQVMSVIQNFYMDTVNMEKISDAAIVKMLEELDPHSSYIPKKEVKEANEPLQGNFEGIGITFNMLNDTVFVISPISGGPSEKVGIMAGDRIIKVEDEVIAGKGISSENIRKRLLGAKGTKVKVAILRRNVKELVVVTITRDKIPIYSVDASYMINDTTGYIKINRFAQTTLTEFLEGYAKLQALGCKNLVLDLTGNGGGYLETAFRLADQFIDGYKQIVYTQGLNAPRQEFNAQSSGVFEKGKLVVMIDEGSASASEILSGAIQDWDRGTIVGRLSFGKGLVQRQFDLADSSQIRLTIANYYTPSGRSIQKPYNKGSKEYSRDIINRYNSGQLTNADSIHFPENQKYFTKIKKRVVYGGGGIMPDVFVPLDTTGNTPYYRSLIMKGILNSFVLETLDNERKGLKKNYPEFAKYKASFEVGEVMLSDLVKYAEKKELKMVQQEYDMALPQIKMLMKAYFARDLFDNAAFYEIINEQNEIYKEAVTLITAP